MTAVKPERVLEIIEALARGFVARVHQPAVGGKQRRGPQVPIAVPPVAGAARRAAGAENTRRRLVDELLVFLALQPLAIGRRRRPCLQPRLDRRVLRVEVRQIRHEILDDRHVRQRVDFHRALHVFDRLRARKCIAAVNVHRAAAADPLATGAAERQGRIDIVLDLDQRVENHGPTAVEIDFVGIDTGIGARVGIVAVHGELLDPARSVRTREVLAFLNSGILR